MNEDKVILTLKCKHCENDKCAFCPRNTIIGGEEGCTREVSEFTAEKYYHYVYEVLPFGPTYSLKQVQKGYVEIINFLFAEVYTAPIQQKLDKDGKVADKK